MAKKTAKEPSLFADIRHPKKRKYLAALAETGNTTEACDIAGIHRTTPYTRQWAEDEAFQVAKAKAIESAADLLEQEARRRAYEGVEEPVGWYRGQAGGTVTRYSDTLLIFLLKSLRPERYRERVEHSTPTGQPLAVIYLPDNGRN